MIKTVSRKIRKIKLINEMSLQFETIIILFLSQ